MIAAGKAARLPTLTPMRHKGARRSCALTKSAPASEVLHAPSEFRVTPLLAGSKKAQELAPLKQTLAPTAHKGEGEVLELDEMWSFVYRRSNKRWIWVAQCRGTRQVVAYAIGNRGQASCRLLWERIPESYRRGVLYSDFWESYQRVLPEDRHRAVGKSEGQTSHVERWNNTLRQRLARFVRKTLSFSKSEEMHEVCLKLFLHRYNADVILR
jgi:insertion element IS1 protein InsB